MPGKFVVKKGSTGKFRFSLLSTNGQTVATSEAYNSKAACMNGVKAVRTLAEGADVEDQTTRQWAAAEDARKTAAAERKRASKRAPAKKAAAKKATAKKSTSAGRSTARRAPAKRAARKTTG